MFRKERKDQIPDKDDSPYQNISDLQVKLEGAIKQLQQLTLVFVLFCVVVVVVVVLFFCNTS